MKTEKTDFGWKEISTKVFRIQILDKAPMIKVGEFIKTNKRLGLQKKRMSCSCCKKKWKNINHGSGVYLAYTDKGNMPICEDCFGRFLNYKERIER